MTKTEKQMVEMLATCALNLRAARQDSMEKMMAMFPDLNDRARGYVTFVWLTSALQEYEAFRTECLEAGFSPEAVTNLEIEARGTRFEQPLH